MTTPDILDLGDLVGDACNFAEIIRMAHVAPRDAEAKAVAAAAFHVTNLLEEVQEGLAALARPEAPAPKLAALLKDWKAAREVVNESGGDDAEVVAKWLGIEAAMLAIPSRTPADLAIKLYAFTSGEVVKVCPQSQPLIAEIERLTGEKCE